MSDSPLYETMREFIRATVALEVNKAMPEVRNALIREAPKVVEGPPGPAGRDGKDGSDGTNGGDGKDGAPGVPGEKGDTGERGTDGLQGRDGSVGLDGRDGEKGERGSDGIATRAELDEVIEQRFGELQVRTFADVYQGVYEPNRTYTRGLLTTWGGSLWLSQSDTKTKPGESPDWKLVVKKGSDGRK